MQGPILVVNAGSSSIKFSGYAAMDEQEPTLLLKGQIEGIGTMPHLVAKDANGGIIAEKTWPRDDKVDHEVLFGHLVDWMRTHLGGEKPVAIGHRVVHGGTRFRRGDAHRRRGAGPLAIAVSAGAVAPAAQSRGDPRHRRCGAIAAAGRLLRHRLPS